MQTEANIIFTIIIPTFNRSSQIESTLLSIVDTCSGRLKHLFRVVIVDNNSQAEDAVCYVKMVNRLKSEIDIVYCHEPRQGRSHACNAGAEYATSKWIAFIDDDETISAQWLETAFKLCDSEDFSYYGGNVLPTWEAQPPPWLPIHRKQYLGVLGWIELSDVDREYDSFDASLCGGNMIVLRELYLSIGGFSSALGRGSNNLLGGEDGEFHRRLKQANAKGCYIPKLSVFHWIPIARMTVNYHLNWAYWSGVSNRIRITTEPQTAEVLPHIFGVPRYRFSKGAQGLSQCIFYIITWRFKKKPQGVIGLLDFMYLLGLLRGKKEGERLGIKMQSRSAIQ